MLLKKCIDSIYARTEGMVNTAINQHADIAACLADTTNGCFNQIIDQFGQPLWRRPVSTEEHNELEAGRVDVEANTGTRRHQLQFILQALLLSPNMLYRVEFGQATNGITDLTSYELASVLSYSRVSQYFSRRRGFCPAAPS